MPLQRYANQRFFCLGVVAIGLMRLAHAQTARPDIGTALRETEPSRASVPAPPSQSLEIVPPTFSYIDSRPDPRFPISRIRISGADAASASELDALVSGFTKRDVTLGELRQAAEKVSEFYRAHGFALARAYLPAQEIRDGAVEIAVLEGRYGALVLQEEAAASKRLIRSTLASVTPGAIIRVDTLERELRLLQQLQGIQFAATLQPGAQVGTSDLVLRVSPNRPIRGSLEADNSGNRYTGEWRLTAGLGIANLAGRGDLLSVRGVVSETAGVRNGSVGYQLPLRGGLQASALVARTDYSLGRQFAQLGANGEATLSKLAVRYPLARTSRGGVDVQLAAGYQDLSDIVDATSTVNRRWSREAELTLSGDVHDGFLGGGVTAGSIAYSSGSLRLRDSTAELIDQISARTAGRYDKTGFTALRLQRFNETFELYLGLSGQLAGGNLDPSEKLTLGGPYAVRAYPQGEGAGDSGMLGTTELRYNLPALGAVGALFRAQTLLFFDAGRIQINQDPFSPGQNRRSLYGAGLGLNLSSRNGFGVRGSWAWKLGDEPVLSAEDSGSRGWVQFAKQF